MKLNKGERARMRKKLAAARGRLVGRRIVRVELNPFDGSRGYLTTDPVLVLDDGTRLSFVVDETDVGEYGIEMCISRPRE